MKKILLPAILAFAAIFYLPCCMSCTQPAPETPENEDPPVVDPGTDPGTQTDPGKPQAGDYTFTVSPLKEKWEAGDQIYVHGNYAPAAKTFTLKASDISSDGKKATLHLDAEMMEFLAAPDNLYASYPADAVLLGDGLMGSDTDFTKWDTLLAVAYLDGTDFAFADACTILKFKVSGYDRFALADNNRNGMRILSFNTDYTSAKPVIGSCKSDGYPFLVDKIEGGAVTLLYPGNVNFKNGYTLFFGKDGAWPMVYKVDEAVKLDAGKMTDLGDITASLTAYDGPEPRMPEISGMTKYKVNINEFSGLCLSEDKSFLWAIDDNGKLGKIDISNNVGEVLEYWSLGGDPEGITLHPETGDLIVGNEEPVSVGVIKAPVSKGDKQSIVFKIKEAKGFGNAGMEGITYYKKDGEKDLVYCGTQTDALLFLCDMNAAVDESNYTTLVAEPISLRKRFPGVLEIAGLSYDPLTDWLWMIDSEAHKIFVFSGDASTLIGAYSLKTRSNEEGICIDHSRNCVWVADDYGSTSYLYKYEFSDLDDFVIDPAY